MADLERLDDLARHRIEHGNGSGLLGSDPDVLSIRRHLDAFRLCADVDGLGYVARGDVDDADGRLVFVRYVELRAILADVEVFRIRAAMDGAHDFILRNIEDADSIGASCRAAEECSHRHRARQWASR